MSFDTGSSSYAPPPAPPRRGLSPWAWVGIGCGGLSLLGFGGCIAVGAWLSSVASRPVDPQKVQATLTKAEVPLYPGATLDEKVTKAAGMGMNIASAITGGKAQMVFGAYRVPDSPDKLIPWYQQKLRAIGYAQRDEDIKRPGGRPVHQVQFLRDDILVLVQSQGAESADKGAILTLMVAQGEGIKQRGARGR